ncbi:MAG TPA: hypothetical protein VJR58_00240 [Vineibacter sp.]|nr:hypothetical protein [Vineibacter sp.]
MNRRRVLALPLALVASGCAPARLELPPMSEERIKSVVILTSFGDTVHLKYSPMFWFTAVVSVDNQYAQADWGVDNHVRAQLVERLKDKCEIKTVNYNSADLAASRNESPTAVAERLRRIVPAGLADAIILVRTSARPQFDELDRDQQKIALIGIGLAAENNPLAGVRTVAFARSAVGIFDGRTFELIASRRGTGERSGHDDIAPVLERLPFPYTGGGWAQLSQDQRTQLRDTVFRLLDRTVTFTLGPHIDGVDKPSDALATASRVEFDKLQARDAKRWNAVMARLGLPSTP